VVDVTEYHTATGEGILPLDADALIHVAPATAPGDVPADRVEIFRVPKGTFVSLRPGVWHHAPFAHGSDVANVLIVLPERTYANDCIVQELAEEQQVEVGE
jgi:ureidoglycolate lyase